MAFWKNNWWYSTFVIKDLKMDFINIREYMFYVLHPLMRFKMAVICSIFFVQRAAKAYIIANFIDFNMWMGDFPAYNGEIIQNI